MFGLNSKFYIKTIVFLDTISAAGLPFTTNKCVNKTKFLFNILASVLMTLAAVTYQNPFISKSSNELLDTYSTFSSFSGLLCGIYLIVKLSFQTVNKNKALQAAELVLLRIKKHSISVSKSAALDFCKELCFILQYVQATLYILVHNISIYNIVTDSVINKTELVNQLSSQILALFHVCMFYSFVMLNLFLLESFLKIEQEILATANPKNLTLSINKKSPPVNEVRSSVFTITTQSHGWFKDVRSKQIRTMINDYCVLEDIRTFVNAWHSAPLTYLLICEALFLPKLPMDRKLYESFTLTLFIMLLLTVVSMIASNLYYLYTKTKLRNSLSRSVYRSSEVRVQRQLMNFELLLSYDLSTNYWKWFTIDCSLLMTLFDTSVLIFTTFVSEIVTSGGVKVSNLSSY